MSLFRIAHLSDLRVGIPKPATQYGTEMATQETSIKDPAGRSGQKALTQRQREVLQLLAEGKTMKQAADILAVTPRTIAFHKYKMMEALGIKRTAKLIHFAVRNHIVSTSGI